jgi:diguanylate cyclase (GGDEF)-like protein
MGRLTARLLAALGEEQIFSTLEDNLPQIGIRFCRVAFFEPRGGDPYAESTLLSRERESSARFETRRFPPDGIFPDKEPLNLAILPLFFQQESIGYVAFDGGNLDPLAMIVIQLATAVKSARLHAKVLELSLTDSLTEVYNRRYFEILLEKEADRCRRYSRDLAVILIDIDRFKEYNDTFGHLAGDEALREIAGQIRSGARRGLDVVTRYGGEEFAVILPETDGDGAWMVAETVRKTIEGSGRFLRRLTVSCGIAAIRGGRADPQILVRQADRALYRSKNLGRNRSTRFEEGMQESAHPNPAGE